MIRGMTQNKCRKLVIEEKSCSQIGRELFHTMQMKKEN